MMGVGGRLAMPAGTLASEPPKGWLQCAKLGFRKSDPKGRNVRKATVLRGTDTLDIYIDHSMIGEVLNTPGMFDLAVPFVVESFMEGSPNVDSGLVKGDRIVSIEGREVPYVQDSRPVLETFAGQTVSAVALRDADSLQVRLQVDTTGRVGIYMTMPGYQTRRYNFLTAIPAGFKETFSTIGGYIKDLRLVATPSTQAYKSVGLYEMVTGRKPNDRFLTIMQVIGMVLLMALMFLAFGNDIGRLIK